MSIAKVLFQRGRARIAACGAALLLGAMTAAPVSAETLMMPTRDMLAGTSEVVWGITTLPLPNTTSTFTIDFGDGTVTAPAAVADRSYIAVNHTYALAGVRTATLTVTNGATTETATVTINVYNPASLSAFDLRNLNVNRAIDNGLRYLWVSQSNRTTFDTTIETGWAWGGFTNAGTALAVEAFLNHGYRLPNSNAAPTGLYEKYVVRRGFNYILARMTSVVIGNTPAGNNPCLVVGDCNALYATTTGDPGYENGIALLPFAGSGSLNRTVTEVANANVNGKTFGEILQRMVNASIWGQNDVGTGRGGWYYTFNASSSDGSTNGWQLLGLLAAEAAGATVPGWVRTEWALALAAGLNASGTFDYQADNNRASNSAVNIAKTGVGVQGMFFAGRPTSPGAGGRPVVRLLLGWRPVQQGLRLRHVQRLQGLQAVRRGDPAGRGSRGRAWVARPGLGRFRRTTGTPTTWTGSWRTRPAPPRRPVDTGARWVSRARRRTSPPRLRSPCSSSPPRHSYCLTRIGSARWASSTVRRSRPIRRRIPSGRPIPSRRRRRQRTAARFQASR